MAQIFVLISHLARQTSGTIEEGWYDYMIYGGLPHSLTFKGESGKVTNNVTLWKDPFVTHITKPSLNPLIPVKMTRETDFYKNIVGMSV